MKNKFWIEDMPKYSIMIFFILNGLSMYLYPGGNMNDIKQSNYSFIYNFFSDLGMTISHSGENNIASCVLFNTSLCVIGICFTMLFLSIRNIFSNYKILSFFATAFGVYGALSYIGVALTPSNLYLELHSFFAHWIFRSLFLASMLYALLIVKTKDFENKYAFGFMLFGMMVLAYVFYSEFYLQNPRLFPDSLIRHVIAQKLIAFWILIAIYFYSIGLGKYLFRKKIF